MESKKEAVMLGMLAIGGIGAAMVIANGDAMTPAPRAGGVLGVAPGTVYNIPAAAGVTFPKAPTFDIKSFLSPKMPPDILPSRGTAGVSAAPKKVRPYIYTGGEVKTGAVSVAPWAMGRTTPAEMGVTTALGLATKSKSTTTKKKEVSARKATPGRMGYSKAARAAGFA